MINEETVIKAVVTWLDKHFGGSKRNDMPVDVIKSVDVEQRKALFVVLEPQAGEYTADLHGDTYTAKDIEEACENFNTHCMKANLFHQIEIEDAQIVQSFINPATFSLDDGRVIKAGSWLQWWHFPEGNEASQALWDAVKAGTINGVSIQANAVAEQINE